MANEGVTIGQLPELTTANNSTLFVVQHTANSIANTYYIKQPNIFKNETPANSTVTVVKGTIYYDSNYLYVATANNTLKRVALSSF